MRLRFLPYGTLLAAFAFFIVSVSSAQVLSRDAAGVRIFQNPEGWGAADWYADQCVKGVFAKCGKPTPVIVDGYDGIRDGDSVYVNVANKTSTSMFTNIYLISFAKGASVEGAKVFDQLFKNWRFNTNPGMSADARGALRRDTRRRATLLSLRRAVEAYKTKTGKYPDLASGSYIRGVTFSSWPSWQQSFGTAVGGALPADPGRPYRIPDPQNPGKETIEWKNFVGCGAPYDAGTCWDAKAVTMACPSAAYVYAYRVLAQAQSYELTTMYESAVVPGKWTDDHDQHDVTATAWRTTVGCTAIARSADTDTDADGVKDSVDNCPDISNAGNADADRDGKGDVCDVCPYDDKNDADGDGICADRDSCPNKRNIGDANGNGIDDACDSSILYSVQGSAWSPNVGWILMNPAGGGVAINRQNRFLGFAWNTNTGWIDMSGAHVEQSGAVVGTAQGSSLFGAMLMNPTGGGVTIDPTTGIVAGQAWSAQTGWIRFGTEKEQVTTTWKP